MSCPMLKMSLAGLLLHSLFWSGLVLCALPASNNLHSDVPSSCPDENRTRIVEQTGTGDIVIGQIFDDQYLVNRFAQGDVDGLFVNTGGVYLLPIPVPYYRAKIVSFRGFGFPGRTFNQSLDSDPLIPAASETDAVMDDVAPFIYVLVYRPTGESYNLVQNLTQLAHGFAPGRLPADRGKTLDWLVQKGDYIGAYIPYSCVNRTSDDLLQCPSQINLFLNNCYSALYHPAVEGVNNILMSEFKEVSILLNLEAIMVPLEQDEPLTSSSSRVVTIVSSVVGVIVVLGLLVAVGLSVWLISRSHHKASLRALYEHHYQEGGPGTLVKEKDFGVGRHDYEEGTTGENGDLKEKRQSYAYVSDVPPVSAAETTDGYTLVMPESVDMMNGDVHGYDYDYQTPYFEPASQEAELLVQLSAKLAVTEIERSNLQLCEVLGSGAFGTVYRGVWSHSAQEGEPGAQLEEVVAVKTMEKELSDEDKIKFLQEATIMAQFKHPSIVSLKGVLLKDELMIVLDLMEGGDLRKHLHTTMRPRLKTMDSFESASTLLSYMRQVAVGMSYLQFKCYVHRDLAARNVLVSSDGTVCKIADFGLSRELQHENFYVSHGGKIPVKWTAPEALKYRKYSTASDVWSFGCVLYEIWSLGEKPFQEMTNQEAMKHVMAGNRLPPPPGCPRSVYTTMIQCWHPDNEQRPSFGEIVLHLNKPDYLILKWTSEDTSSYSEEARTLGSSLENGRELYKELQTTYLTTDLNSTDKEQIT